ncbi:hypothetical protein A7U60_g1717 [Sanghuangporus baumii]|uniref:Uncharacterized protein n=1 Tax=Sanghuangporus baumii TaxID=108892 RepID=A0A9Q5NEG5_SANBA|nr:hypothetical protein A7U60_g1717 [Sanghuangporus baumii]
MPRLHLKRTPAEEEERARRKSTKTSKKHKERRSRYAYSDDDDSERKQHHPRSRSRSPGRGSNYRFRKYHNQDPFSGDSGPSSYAHSREYVSSDDDPFQARAEEERFEEKLRDALEDDRLYDSTQRLDNVEARLNSYAHIPRRWRGTDDGFSAGLWMEDAREDIGLEPWQMNDDEYAEYIRAGMWRKKNQAEFEERLRKKEERRRRGEREQRRREETRRLEREAQAEREKHSAVKARRRLEEARRLYEERWTILLARPASSCATEDRLPISFADIPWPIAVMRISSEEFIEQLTKDAVSSFLLRSGKEIDTTDGPAPSTKDILRTTMLRFHPDKFEARVLARVEEKDRDLVKESASVVIRILNDLMKDLRD